MDRQWLRADRRSGPQLHRLHDQRPWSVAPRNPGGPSVTLEATIDAAWEARADLSTATQGEVRDAVTEALNLLDSGKARVAEPVGDGWQVNQWLKKAVLLSFRLNDNAVMPGGFDKVPLKTSGWDDARFREAGFRQVPGSIVRHGAFISKGVVLMPSFV
ncbi:MAG: hypothetical protein EOP60_13405, partial [Sphingomonadales bacterium]